MRLPLVVHLAKSRRRCGRPRQRPPLLDHPAAKQPALVQAESGVSVKVHPVVGEARWGSSGSCTRLSVWVVIALLSAAAGRSVCAAARALVPRRSSSREPRWARPGSRAAARPLRRTLARHGFRAGGSVSRPAGLSKAEAYD